MSDERNVNAGQTLAASGLLAEFDALLTDCLNDSFDCGEHDGTIDEYAVVKSQYDASKERVRAWVRAHVGQHQDQARRRQRRAATKGTVE